jgi:hypothetical protein
LEDADTLLFSYVPASTNLSFECDRYCVTENSFGVYGYSCQGYCVNLTLANGRKFASCNVDKNGTFGSPDWLSFIIGFYTFRINIGVPVLNFILPIIFVYLPVFVGLGFVILSYFRGNN